MAWMPRLEFLRSDEVEQRPLVELLDQVRPDLAFPGDVDDEWDGLSAGIGPDDVEEESCFGGDSRSRTENDLVEGFQLVQLELVVAEYGDIRSQLFQQMGKIIGERVVVIDDDGFGVHNSTRVFVVMGSVSILLSK